jgi:hypothetical protein
MQTASLAELVEQAWLALQQIWSFQPQGFEHRFSSGFPSKANGEAIAIGIK